MKDFVGARIMRSNKMESSLLLTPKEFDAEKHKKTISQLRPHMDFKEFEQICSPIAIDILQNYEGFEKVTKGPQFTGTPFDFFGFKDGEPYIIELKCSLKYFHTPSETQKRRMQELLNKIIGLRIALLQVKVGKAQYRILYNDEMDDLFEGAEAPLEPIEKWLRNRMRK
jgi:hypothetical protein